MNLRTAPRSRAPERRERPAASAPSMLPDFVVIGAMKSGTTSLHYYLSLHPDIVMSNKKEPTFFTREGQWENGVDWYASQFDGEATLVGEASPDYTKFPRHAGVPARMHSVLPDAKLVYVVRDPIERLISHYVDAYSFGRVHRPLNDALDDDEGRHYVACSKYFFQIEQYLPFYDPGRILVVQTEALAARRAETLSRIFSFLGADPTFSDDGFARVLYQRGEHRRKSRVGYAAVRLAEQVRRTSSGGGFPRRSPAPSMRSIPPPQSPWRSPSSPRSGGKSSSRSSGPTSSGSASSPGRARRLVSLTELRSSRQAQAPIIPRDGRSALSSGSCIDS